MISLPQNDRGTWLLVWLLLFGVGSICADRDSHLGTIDFDAKTNKRSGLVNLPLLLNSKIDLNSASFQELRHIPKLNSKVANAILEKRSLLGRFTSYEQIDEISGVGVKTLESIRRHTQLVSVSP